jgi:hypothetical protein
MARWKKVLIVIAAGMGCAVAALWAGGVYLDRQAAAQSKFGQIGAEVLEREVRNALPVGSLLDAVETFSQKRGLEFSFEKSSKTVYAMARDTKGSNFIILESLGFQFHFDNESKLTSIDSKIYLTGP